MNDINLDSVYKHAEVEEKWYNMWVENGYFHTQSDYNKKPYAIVIPPPNVTGILHMGHALNNAIQDILIRYKRLSGSASLWLPGTDHAGIATQNVVEKKLKEEQTTRFDLGREDFLKRVWQWKEQYGSTIINQLKKLGSSCDWERLHFTMDETHSNAVLEAFIRLYKKGLIYKGNYIINWCPRCETALSDEEAQHKQVEGSFYYLKYQIEGTSDYVTVATTRPETMLGDVACAISPKDDRYKDLAGKTIILPIQNRKLSVVFDDFVDPEFGTGVVKVTPAHDPDDFELSLRHNLTPINVMNPNATMNENAGKYNGQDRFECRKNILDELNSLGLLDKTTKHEHSIGHCYRCHTVVEPRLSRQWFVRMKPLAKKAADVVRKGRVKFYPSRWTKVYLNWIDNVRDWCISRQIWWGHRIPVYYCKDCITQEGDNLSDETTNKKGVIVSKTKPDKCPDCGQGSNLAQDEDVLDTWFSSWLWPFSTFNWPNLDKDFTYFYPTSTLVTAQEIIFFWVARMVMASLEFIGEIPFKDVYIHGTVRDQTGAKMSKSLGNIIDPLEVIDEFGADVLRFSLISITATGQDVYLSKEKFHLGRNFANKLWNASRFILMNLDKEVYVRYTGKVIKDNLSLCDRWILSNLSMMSRKLNSSLKRYNFNEAGNILYEFIWHKLCDWYIEFTKPHIEKVENQMRLVFLIDNVLRMLHPFMPFITEELWQKFPHRGESIMMTDWPKLDESLIDEEANEQFGLVIELVSAIRNIRSQMQIPPSKSIDVICVASREKDRRLIEEMQNEIKFVARVENIKISRKLKRPKKSSYALVGDMYLYVPLEGLIDFQKEKERLDSQYQKLNSDIESLSKKLKNRDFVKKAPKEVVDQERKRSKEILGKIDKLQEALESLK